MFALNVSCAVCKELFKKTDAIYSTSCGHIFHYICLNQWKCKTTSCPVCRTYNPTSQSIFLNFEDGFDHEKVFEDLNTKLKNVQDKIKEIEEDNDKKENKIDAVKRLYNVSEQWRAEREDKIKKLTAEYQLQNEKHSQELASKLKEIQTLQRHIETLGMENGVVKLTENVKELSAENSKLKSNLRESETLRIILNQKIEMLEQRYKHVTSELEKQLNESVKKEIKQEFQETQKTRNRHSRRNSNESQKVENLKLLSVEEQQLNSHDKTTKKMDSYLNQFKECKLLKLKNPNDYKIIIIDFPKTNIVLPLKDIVILLANKMNITIAEEDVLRVNYLNIKHRNLSNNVQLLVEFKSMEAKSLFLTHKNRLKFNNSTKFIKIKEYIDENIYPIFMYANRNLRSNGYEYIDCKNNKVIAKKKLNDTEEIVIQCQNDVDLLLKCENKTEANRMNARNIFDNLFPFFNID